MRPKEQCISRDCKNKTKLSHEFCHSCLISLETGKRAAQTREAGGKHCKGCGKFTPLDGFSIAKQNGDGHQNNCRECLSKRYHEKYKATRKSGGAKVQNNFDTAASARLLSKPLGAIAQQLSGEQI